MPRAPVAGDELVHDSAHGLGIKMLRLLAHLRNRIAIDLISELLSSANAVETSRAADELNPDPKGTSLMIARSAPRNLYPDDSNTPATPRT